eukprot:1860433-Pleurochrysis_carterae.AAC.4
MGVANENCWSCSAQRESMGRFRHQLLKASSLKPEEARVQDAGVGPAHMDACRPAGRSVVHTRSMPYTSAVRRFDALASLRLRCACACVRSHDRFGVRHDDDCRVGREVRVLEARGVRVLSPNEAQRRACATLSKRLEHAVMCHVRVTRATWRQRHLV